MPVKPQAGNDPQESSKIMWFGQLRRGGMPVELEAGNGEKGVGHAPYG
jgi:hypothetical protein